MHVLTFICLAELIDDDVPAIRTREVKVVISTVGHSLLQ